MRTVANPVPSGWSKSGIGTLIDGCSWQYLLVKSGLVPDESSPQAVLGTTYHAAVERRERARISRRRGVDVPVPTLDELEEWGLDQLTGGMNALSDREWSKYKGTPADLADSLHHALVHWHEHFAPIVDRWVPLTREPYVQAPTPYGHGTRGYIDGVYWDPDESEWAIVDDKSTAHYRSWPADGEGHEREGAMYTVLARRAAALPVDVARMEWHLVRTETSNHHAFQASRRIIRRFDGPEWTDVVDGDVALAQQIVDTAEYVPNPGWFLCSETWCPAYDPCQVTGELAHGMVEVTA